MLIVVSALAGAGWTGSEDALLPDDAAQAALPTSVLPFSLHDFFLRHYDRSMLRLNHTQTGFDPRSLWGPADFASNIAAIVADSKAHDGGVIKPYRPPDPNTKKANKSALLPADVSPERAVTLLEQFLANGTSFVLAFEKMSEVHRPFKWLADALFAVTGIPASIHLYCSAHGAEVLGPHTDPYDVLVWQLQGSKSWRACVPKEELGLRTFNVSEPLSDAQRCLLQELVRDNIRGCTSYTVDDQKTLECEEFTMAPGDVIYMPKGVVHHALTHNASSSSSGGDGAGQEGGGDGGDGGDGFVFHLTIGLHRTKMQWLDVLTHMLISLAPPPPPPSPSPPPSPPPSSPEEAAVAAQVATLRELLEVYSKTAEGVHMHEAVPGWLLRCLHEKRTPPALVQVGVDARGSAGAGGGIYGSGGSDLGGGVGGNRSSLSASCPELMAELARIFSLHVSRFGSHLYRLAQSGAWRHASALAAKEARPGAAPDMPSVDSIFWWRGYGGGGGLSGGLALLSRLADDGGGGGGGEAGGVYGGARLQHALAHVARVVDWKDSEGSSRDSELGDFGWQVRGGPGGGGGQLRRPGEARPGGTPSLCDELDGWTYECRSSGAELCDTHVDNATAFSCAQFCEGHGAWCEGAWDDARASPCAKAPLKKGQPPSCEVKRKNQICACRRECTDTGPWPCAEEGCPARQVTCEILAVACDVQFEEIWDKPPVGVAELLVAQACPMTCGRCVSPAPHALPDAAAVPSWLMGPSS